MFMRLRLLVQLGADPINLEGAAHCDVSRYGCAYKGLISRCCAADWLSGL
jgi:hypothetical protein